MYQSSLTWNVSTQYWLELVRGLKQGGVSRRPTSVESECCESNLVPWKSNHQCSQTLSHFFSTLSLKIFIYVAVWTVHLAIWVPWS